MKNIDELLKTVRRIHFIGIGGSGMCPIVEILHQEGYSISGSDNNESDTLARVRKLGIPVTLGQRAENIGDAEMIIYTAAILPDNPELRAAVESGVPTFERAVILGAITRLYPRCAAVAGTHGKTTTSAMLTQILLAAGIDPTAVIGGKLPKIQASGRVGKSDVMVCEACEFKAHFLELSPAVSVILNIDNDHMEFFGTIENSINYFRKFIDLTSSALVVNGDDANTLKAVEGVTDKEIITYGFGEGNDYTAANVTNGPGIRIGFDLMHKGELLTHITANVPGRHNVLNAMAAAATAIYLGATPNQVANGLADFGGAGRRFEVLGNVRGVTIADDYAHHPAELKVTLEAAKKLGFNSVWAVFQPFTYSRTKLHMDYFAQVLQIADRVVMSEIMGSREVNTEGVYTSQLAEKIPGSVWFNTFEEIADYIAQNAQRGDLVITLGCGDIYKAAKIMLKKMREQ